MLQAGYKMLAILQVAEKPVFIPTSPYLLYMVQQKTHFHASSLGDLYLAARYDPAMEEVFGPYRSEIEGFLASRSITTAILPNASWYDGIFSEENGYICVSAVAEHGPLITLTGAISYLERICRFSP